ncbi:hypothetical protein BHM03_00001787 [Ensete ventricosum]|nr:hypothetical protein BHM03_00001787 [Ensete ventricosum]
MFTVTVRNPYSSLVGSVRYQMVGPTMCWYTSIWVQSNKEEEEEEDEDEDEDENKEVMRNQEGEEEREEEEDEEKNDEQNEMMATVMRGKGWYTTQ